MEQRRAIIPLLTTLVALAACGDASPSVVEDAASPVGDADLRADGSAGDRPDAASEAGPGTDAGGSTPSPACDELGAEVTGLLDALDRADEPCRVWLDAVRGRVAHNASGSAVVWSRRTDGGVGLLVSAMHVLGEGWFAPGGEVIPEQLRVPPPESGVWRLALPSPDGEPVDTSNPHQQHALWTLYNPEVPAEQSGSSLTQILPRYDYFVGVTDGQVFDYDPMFGLPGPPATLGDSMLALFDPQSQTLDAPTSSEAVDGAPVVLLGYPQASHPNGAVSVGAVLSDAAAVAAVEALEAAGDPEGDIVYDPEAELIIEGSALAGMSGGGVFDRGGVLIGVMVRASDDETLRYVRATRMSFIRDALSRAHEAGGSEAREGLDPLLREETR